MDNIIQAGDTYHNRYSKDRQYNKKGKNSKRYKPLPKKCARCGTTKGPFDLHHKDGNRKNSKRSDLQVLCRSCHRKLHDGGAKANVAQASNVFVDVEIVEKPSRPEILNQAMGKEKPEDLMLVEFKLCHAGVNNNLDEFLQDEMSKSYETAKFKPINWEHSDKNIGVIYDSQFVEGSDDEKSYIKCSGYIWKYKFPEESAEMYSRYVKGSLTFSMETYFKKAECSACNELFEKSDDYCEHLMGRYVDRKTSRKLHDINYGGAGVVKNPADEDATGDLIVASLHTLERPDAYYELIASLVEKGMLTFEDFTQFRVTGG